ncbi:type II toxin-antitoxin system HicB family antitoxin [Shouchella sp. JSM 1781072]|uniref:HicB family protein n=1 Tax=Bacillaceae TaxID=186817 RepID=UPI000C07138F|nr:MULTISPECIES: HicB family protein [Bacillaceae]UTR05359.1 type II toxin-antitoxin system HicB family antitoxin [Alkalihalobacillus sp. LMS6]
MGQGSYISFYDLRVRKVFNWLGATEMMVELMGLEECVGFGDTFLEAKKNLNESIIVWEQTYGKESFPPHLQRPQIIWIDAPMDKSEFAFINHELLALEQG